MQNKDVLSGLFIPEDGQADPEILTKNISIAAKKRRKDFENKLEKFLRETIRSEELKPVLETLIVSIVLCAGMWSRQIGEAAGSVYHFTLMSIFT